MWRYSAKLARCARLALVAVALLACGGCWLTTRDAFISSSNSVVPLQAGTYNLCRPGEASCSLYIIRTPGTSAQLYGFNQALDVYVEAWSVRFQRIPDRRNIYLMQVGGPEGGGFFVLVGVFHGNSFNVFGIPCAGINESVARRLSIVRDGESECTLDGGDPLETVATWEEETGERLELYGSFHRLPQ